MRPISALNKRFSSTLNYSKNPRQFRKILIANRGEIALRIMRTAKKMGINCVSVFSEADKHSQHVKMADEAILIGPAPSSESYLNIENVLEAMRLTGSEAVHPGYGFLSENYKFAEIVEKSGLNFIGPPSTAIKSMGSKSESKSIMIAAGVPCIPGYHGENQNPKYLAEKAEEIGYPIMIKAVLGGGGKGMRIASNSEEFLEMLESAKRESLKSFGDNRVLLEKYIKKSRHVEVQIFADKCGNCVYLFERDCSIQRRNQKIIEEAPAFGLSDQTRKQLGETAVRAAKAVNYVGPGTVEFIYDCSDNSFYFMEMNTRLQVEHPVTEMITGQDLVEWQINAAAGFPMPLKQEDLSIHGHSIEARIYAEIPEKNFVPDTGKLNLFKFPKNSKTLRVETGVKQNDEISIYYDPMIAKVVTHGQDRNEAISRLNSALLELQIDGVHTNVQFIQKILGIKKFTDSEIDTSFIQNHKKELFINSEPPKSMLIVAAISKLLSGNSCQKDPLKYFRIGSSGKDQVSLNYDGKKYDLHINFLAEKQIRLEMNGSTEHVSIVEFSSDSMRMIFDKTLVSVNYFARDNYISIWSKIYGRFDFNITSFESEKIDSEADSNNSSGRILTTMPCKINQIMVKPGDSVKSGSPVCVTEAMKMELVIKSSIEGTVKAVHFKEGDIAPDKALLMEIDPKMK